MNDTYLFNIDNFHAMSGLNLSDYCESFLHDTRSNDKYIAPCDLHVMLANYYNYDEIHKLYTVLLGCKYDPSKFIKFTIELLADSSLSLACAAYNILNNIDVLYISDEISDRIDHICKSGSVNSSINDIDRIVAERRKRN